MLLIYTYKLTERVRFICDLFFNNLSYLEYKITSDKEVYISYNGPKLNYSFQAIDDNEVWIQAQGLLFEVGLSNIDVKVEWQKDKVRFFTTDAATSLNFDVFSASFYLVSRYEEYLPHKKDQYGRYAVEESIAFKNDFIKKPVVNYWCEELKHQLLTKYPELEIKGNEYEFISSIDVDNAFAYVGKGFVRTLGAIFRSVLTFEFIDLTNRLQCLFGMKKDPYDTFDLFKDAHNKHKVNALYFFLVADYDVNDKNVPITSRKFQSVIKGVSDYFEVGIHPSYASNTNAEKVKIEKDRLEKVCHRDITKSRQHFLKLNLPKTYTKLIDEGISEDYTMGYASELGFRASIARPFKFYNFDDEQATRLTIHPFALMEATLKYYRNVEPEHAMSHFKPIIDEVKQVNGQLISLWHSDSLSEHHKWKGWRNLYDTFLQEAK